MSIQAIRTEENLVTEEPYYEPVGNEVEVYAAAFQNQLPILLKGPTGCGKTRFVEYMSWRLQRPMITVACHDDLTASDLVGRFLVKGGETVWVDGPLTRAARNGCICYLDEIVEARKDTSVVIHPLCDDRRLLPIDKLGELLQAPDEFCLTISYNPGYQSVLKDLKQSTRQRFVALEFDYPNAEKEQLIIEKEAEGIDKNTAKHLVKFGTMTRNLKGGGLDEGASTRLLVNAAKLVVADIDPVVATDTAVALALTDDLDMLKAVHELSRSVF
ncbi:MAG: CbbQ/NirQ/NorQ/GpvN family protein [Gammaproteobacteria bacterium]